MKLFLDTANIDQIKQWAAMGLVDGVTTNPTHLSKEHGDPVGEIKEICALLPEGEISVQVTEAEPEAVYAQAKAITKLSDNILVKIPCSMIYYPVIKKLVSEDVNINITLVFSLAQGLAMCKLGVYCISPFVGRLDDIDAPGIDLISDLRIMIDRYGFETQLLAASLRTVPQLHEVILAGADIATVPASLLEKALSHPLTDKGMQIFADDWKKLGIKKFP